MARKNLVEKQYEQMYAQGVTKKQSLDQHALVMEIMRHGFKEDRKIWWFVHELTGNHKLKGVKYFMSYKASSRVAELAKIGDVESRPTQGKLRVYALKEVLDKYSK